MNKKKGPPNYCVTQKNEKLYQLHILVSTKIFLKKRTVYSTTDKRGIKKTNTLSYAKTYYLLKKNYMRI